MNLHHSLDKDMQYSFYLNSLRKKKRFSPWILRKDKVQDLECIKKYYGYSNESISSTENPNKEQINFIKKRLDIGGMK